MHTLTYKFSGWSCEACSKLISKRLKKIDGVGDVDVKDGGEAILTVSRHIDNSEIMKALEGTNYQII